MSTGKSFAKQLKEVRTSRKMTQQRLADLADLSKSAISRYEKGVRKPNFDAYNKLKKVLGIDFYVD